MSSAHIKQDGQTIILALNGTEIRLPYKAALEIAAALQAKGKQAEEYAGAMSGRLISDQALVTRLGLPFGLTNHPKIQTEATKEATWNRDLRRYFPGGVRSKTIVGAPTVVAHSPTPEQQVNNRVFWARQKKRN